MKRRPGFTVMAIQHGAEVEEEIAARSLSITTGGSLQINHFKLNKMGQSTGIPFSDIELLGELGRGASSCVFRGYLRDKGQQVAVKQLSNVEDKELRKQLKAEMAFMEICMESHLGISPFLNQVNVYRHKNTATNSLARPLPCSIGLDFSLSLFLSRPLFLSRCSLPLAPLSSFSVTHLHS